MRASIARKKGGNHTCCLMTSLLRNARHTKAECTEERVDDRTCRVCEKVGHVARDCPDKPPAKCNNCKQEGKSSISSF